MKFVNKMMPQLAKILRNKIEKPVNEQKFDPKIKRRPLKYATKSNGKA